MENVKIGSLLTCIKEIYPGDEVVEISQIGGMTNLNYKITLSRHIVVLRVPGLGTHSYIDRRRELDNTKFAEYYNYHPKLLYFNINTGVKITQSKIAIAN